MYNEEDRTDDFDRLEDDATENNLVIETSNAINKEHQNEASQSNQTLWNLASQPINNKHNQTEGTSNNVIEIPSAKGYVSPLPYKYSDEEKEKDLQSGEVRISHYPNPYGNSETSGLRDDIEYGATYGNINQLRLDELQRIGNKCVENSILEYNSLARDFVIPLKWALTTKTEECPSNKNLPANQRDYRTYGFLYPEQVDYVRRSSRAFKDLANMAVEDDYGNRTLYMSFYRRDKNGNVVLDSNNSPICDVKVFDNNNMVKMLNEANSVSTMLDATKKKSSLNSNKMSTKEFLSNLKEIKAAKDNISLNYGLDDKTKKQQLKFYDNLEKKVKEEFGNLWGLDIDSADENPDQNLEENTSSKYQVGEEFSVNGNRYSVNEDGKTATKLGKDLSVLKDVYGDDEILDKSISTKSTVRGVYGNYKNENRLSSYGISDLPGAPNNPRVSAVEDREKEVLKEANAFGGGTFDFSGYEKEFSNVIDLTGTTNLKQYKKLLNAMPEGTVYIMGDKMLVKSNGKSRALSKAEIYKFIAKKQNGNSMLLDLSNENNSSLIKSRIAVAKDGAFFKLNGKVYRKSAGKIRMANKKDLSLIEKLKKQNQNSKVSESNQEYVPEEIKKTRENKDGDTMIVHKPEDTEHVKRQQVLKKISNIIKDDESEDE